MDDYRRIPMSEVQALYGPRPGRHWFDPETTRFFLTKIPGVAIQTPHGNYFVSQETSPSGVTAYSVRRQDRETGLISTLGLFHCYTTYEEARIAMHDHIKAKEEAHV